ncbi:hypothetical protein [Zobellia uliginosa]|uniref:hypothetical protein n=1 Tax=Zobellia uliginosa TaxID=143224 RepID=UPI001C070A67|nr:hypothetical protein [Zobellia uliginosa]MBU2946288.1 hypothetical protein [Zobellia uliginosa]
MANPQGYAEQLQKDKETFTAMGNMAKKAGTFVYRNSAINMLTDPADYMAAQQENAVMAEQLMEKAANMSAEEWGDFTGQVLFEVGMEVATAGGAAALTAAKVADKTVDAARALDKIADLGDAAKAADKLEDISDGTKLLPPPKELGDISRAGEKIQDGAKIEVPEELGDVVHLDEVIPKKPSDFGVTMIADNPQLLKIWNDTLRKLANSKRKGGNIYKTYLENLRNGVPMDNDFLGDTYKYVRQTFKNKAEDLGHVIDGEIHHWNFPKKDFPDQIANPKNLTEPIDRATHELIHESTSSGTNKFVDKIDPVHEIPINSMKLD